MNLIVLKLDKIYIIYMIIKYILISVFLITTLLGAEPHSPNLRVLVIGAGLSGLQAAQHLQRSHKVDVQVLEARNRVGGRLESAVDVNGDSLELGANWLHTLNADHGLWQFTKEAAEVPTESQVTGSIDQPMINTRVFLGQRDFLVHEYPELIELIDEVITEFYLHVHQAYSHHPTTPGNVQDRLNRTIETLKQRYPPEMSELVELAGQAFALQAFSDQPLDKIPEWGKDFIVEQEPGVEYFVTNGLSRLADYLAKGLPIEYNAVVTAITEEQDGVTVTYQEGRTTKTWQGDFAIITLPLGVLKSGSVIFTPPLSVAKQKAIETLGVTEVRKLALTFDKGAFEKAMRQPNKPLVENRLIYSLPEENTILSVINLRAMQPEGQTSSSTLLVYMSEEAGKLRKLPKEQLVDRILGLLERTYPNLSRNSLIGVIDKTWSEDPFAKGAYSYQPSGTGLQERQELATPTSRLFFAGEHTAENNGMEGALLSGQRAAEQVLRR